MEVKAFLTSKVVRLWSHRHMSESVKRLPWTGGASGTHLELQRARHRERRWAGGTKRGSPPGRGQSASTGAPVVPAAHQGGAGGEEAKAVRSPRCSWAELVLLTPGGTCLALPSPFTQGLWALPLSVLPATATQHSAPTLDSVLTGLPVSPSLPPPPTPHPAPRVTFSRAKLLIVSLAHLILDQNH